MHKGTAVIHDTVEFRPSTQMCYKMYGWWSVWENSNIFRFASLTTWYRYFVPLNTLNRGKWRSVPFAVRMHAYNFPLPVSRTRTPQQHKRRREMRDALKHPAILLTEYILKNLCLVPFSFDWSYTRMVNFFLAHFSCLSIVQTSSRELRTRKRAFKCSECGVPQ